MSTEVKYNSVDVFGSQPTPFVTLSTDMIIHGGRKAQRNSITLNGQITGSTFSSCLTASQSIANGFNNGFKTLDVVEDGVTVASFSGCKVDSIQFNESKLITLVDYSINLSNYDNFSGTLGVVDPAENFSFNMNDDGTSTLTHEVSAKGVSYDGSNPFDNAKNYVLSLSGWNNKITPKFVNGGATAYPILTNTSESIDRINSTYSISENYTFQDGASSYTPIVTYSSSLQKNKSADFDKVDITATVKGGKYFTTDEVLAHSKTLDLHAKAESLSKITDLLSKPLNFNFDQNLNNNTVTVKASYDNNPLFASSTCYFDHTVEMSTDEIMGLTTVSLNGTIKGRGNRKQRLADAESFVESTIEGSDYLYNLANTIYSKFYDNITFPLRIAMDNLSVNRNPKAGEITVSATFTNKDFLNNTEPNGNYTSNVEYTVSVKPSINQYREAAAVNQNGYYIITDLNAKNRETVDFSTTININHAGPNGVYGGSSRISEVTTDPLSAPISLGGRLVNKMIFNLGNTWLGVGASDTILTSENVDYTMQNRIISAKQSYSQNIHNMTYNQAYGYIKVS